MAGTHGAWPVGFLVAGLVGDLHTAKVAMFSIGMKSMIVAAGVPAVTIDPSGTATSGTGVVPNMHWSMAPATTNWGMREF